MTKDTKTTNPPESQTVEHQVASYRYDAKLACEIETRWQQVWDERDAFVVPNPGQEGFDQTKPKFYCLDMFPYPSGAGLHVGHPEGYTATDIVSRYKRMTGHNVLHPMGWDAFGLPAEQYAIRTGVHPEVTTKQAIDNFRRQLKRFGFSYDWSRQISTIDPAYYKWTQWIFLQAYNAWFDPKTNKARPISELIASYEDGSREPKINPAAAEYAGTGDLPGGTLLGPWHTLDNELRRMVIDSYRLAYVGRQTVNWCPKLGTALANEEVIDGKSERGGYPVFRKPMKQWMFRITAYADRLLEGLNEVDWPHSTKVQQTEWIGRSEGAEIDFAVLDDSHTPLGQSLRVFTTRPDTIFGATYMVVAPEHPIVDAAIDEPSPQTDEKALKAYALEARNRSDVQRMESKEKTGVFTGYYARNPATNKPIPIWTADYVLMGYGTGAIMAVPAHDERDFAFAKAFDLPIKCVVKPDADEPCDASKMEQAFTDEGIACNAGFLDGLPTAQAKETMIQWLESHQLGARKINYRLRDWLFSRQRYWGEPFPIVWDAQGHHYAVSESSLPVVLPDMADYAPEESDDPKPLLAKATQWVHTTAGQVGVDALDPDTPVMRETNTMPGWAGSCWYYLRYCDPCNESAFVSSEAQAYWLGDIGVDLYIGGAEHAVLHLLYARFWHKILYDLGHVSTDEPFKKLFHQGMITSHAYQRANKTLVPIDEVEETADGSYIETSTGEKVVPIVAKMSKSLKNVINPDEVIAQYGADTFRLYEMYMGPLEATKPWNTNDIIGLHRFLQRTWRLFVDEETGRLHLRDQADDAIERQLHRTIAKVGHDIERLAFNTAIAAMIELVNAATGTGMSRDQLDRFARILSPFAPHMAEELWHKLDQTGLVGHASWPDYDQAMLRDESVEIVVQILGKTKARIIVPADADAKTLEDLALADAKIQSLIEGKTVRKVIAVPGRLVNIVAN